MADHGQEIASIDFGSMLGGPLMAVVEAQAKAAISTVDFVKSVGFETGEEGQTGDPIYVTFRYPKEVSPYQPATDEQEAVPAEIQEMEIRVPILTILPIPYIRVEETTIDFNVKINSMEYQRTNTSFGVEASAGVRQRWLGGGARLDVSTSYQRSTMQGSNVRRSYSMHVHIRAVQDEMPGGMERVLGILEGAMLSEPVTSGPVEPAD